MFAGKTKSKAFTLVELIIVITILAILATLGIISFLGYASNARDSVRTSDVKNMELGLEVFKTVSGMYPVPDSSVNIYVSGALISKQGYFGENVTQISKMNQVPKDPLDLKKYTYLVLGANSKYQLSVFMENETRLSMNLFASSTYAGEDLNERKLRVQGSKIGILYDSHNIPLQDTGTGIDIYSTNTVYKAIFNNTTDGIIEGTGLVLREINPTGNCKRLHDLGNNSDGMYSINPMGTFFQVYCDMTTDDGGRTLVGRSGNACANLSNFGFIKNTDTPPADISQCYSMNILNISSFHQIKFGLTTDPKKFTLFYGAIFNVNHDEFKSAVDTSENRDFGVIQKGIGACKSNAGIGHWFVGNGGTLSGVGHKLGCGWSGCGAISWGQTNGVDTFYHPSVPLFTLFESCGNLNTGVYSYSVWVK